MATKTNIELNGEFLNDQLWQFYFNFKETICPETLQKDPPPPLSPPAHPSSPELLKPLYNTIERTGNIIGGWAIGELTIVYSNFL
jgi:hypothetical protein